MKHLYLFFIIIFSFQSQAQNTIFKWAKGIQGNNIKSSKDIKVDAAGNVFIVGTFQGIADFDPDTSISNLTSAGNDDIFIAKYTNNGNLIWCKRIGGASQDIVTEMALDNIGNVYITGSFIGTVDFNPGGLINVLSSVGGRNSFVCKLDNNGNYLWAKKFSNAYNEAYSIAIDNNGNCCVTGHFVQTVDFDPGAGLFNLTAQSFATDTYIAKLDSNGNLIWVKPISGLNDEYSYGIGVDLNDNIFCIGSFYGTTDFDPSADTFNLSSSKPTTTDIFITKLDANGNFIWAKAYGDSLDDSGYKLALDQFGNVFAVGWIYGSVNFNNGASNDSITSEFGARNAFILKLDSLGNFIWVNGILGLGEVSPFDILSDGVNKVYLTGNLTYTADFDPSAGNYYLDSQGGADLFVASYFSNGTLDFANNVGGNDPFGYLSATGNAIAIDNNQNIFITGGFAGTIDFDPSPSVNYLTSNLPNVNDLVIIKHGPCINSSSFQSFTFCPGNSISVGNNVYSLTGIYIDTLVNSIGCDSIINTNITLYPTYDSIQTIYLCAGDSVLIDGNYIDSTSFYVQTIIDTNACSNYITSYVNVYQPLNTNVTINNINLTANYPPFIGVTYQWLNCNTGFSPIQGEIYQTFTPIANGSYAVLVGNSNCQDTSACYDFVTVDLPDLNEDFPVLFYPNPVKDILTFSLQNNTSKTCNISLTNLKGEIVFTGNSTKGQIDMSDLASGIYVLSYRNNDGVFHHKLIKQ